MAEGQRVSPKITVGVTPLSGVTVFGTYAEGYRAPHLTETVIAGTHAQFVNFVFLPNPGLRPEVAHNGEVGVNLKYDSIVTTRDAFRAKIVAFRNKVDDYIDQDTFDASGTCFTLGVHCTGSTVQYVNIGRATLSGIEAEVAYDARSWFLAVAAHRIRGEVDATGTPLATVPADQVMLTVGARLWSERLVAGVRTRLVAAQDRVPTATLATDAYTLVDLFAEYQHTENVTFNLLVDNVFDEPYRQYLDQSFSPGLNARFGVTMRFGQ
jgi:hemoglobin/transferrin/lactoferrin receptor protein